MEVFMLVFRMNRGVAGHLGHYVAEYVSGKEQRGATGPELLAGLEADAPGVSQQGCGFSL